MTTKSTPIMLALFGSMLVVIASSLIGTIQYVPSAENPVTLASVQDLQMQHQQYTFSSARTPDEIRLMISDRLLANDPDEAKKLYEELWQIERIYKMNEG